jgi:hypothetical protein
MELVLAIAFVWLIGDIYFTFRDFDKRMKKLEKYADKGTHDA